MGTLYVAAGNDSLDGAVQEATGGSFSSIEGRVRGC
jgi:hypothetical protein